MNDFWVWNPNTCMWTWLSGSATHSSPGSVGAINVAAASNVPRSRAEHSATINPTTGVIYVFGGSSSIGVLNDLWLWDPSNTYWSWISGSTSSNQMGVYGTKGIGSVSNFPGGRNMHSLTLDPRTGDLYLFGGYGYNSGKKYILFRHISNLIV